MKQAENRQQLIEYQKLKYKTKIQIINILKIKPRKVIADIFLFLARLSIRALGAVCGFADDDVAIII